MERSAPLTSEQGSLNPSKNKRFAWIAAAIAILALAGAYVYYTKVVATQNTTGREYKPRSFVPGI